MMTTGISDLNDILIEGTVVANVDRQENTEGGNKKATNFTIEVRSGYGEKFYRHNVVMFQKLTDLFGDKIVNGAFVRIRGHLIETNLVVGEKVVFFSKICADRLEIDA